MKASKSFYVFDPEQSRTVGYAPGDEVPAHIVEVVGDHLFDADDESDAGESSDAYDPADHTVDEVLDHLSGLDPDGDEYAAVIEAEKSGKNRTTIVG